MKRVKFIQEAVLSVSLLFTVGCSTKIESAKVLNPKKATGCLEKKATGCQQKSFLIESSLNRNLFEQYAPKRAESKIFKLKTVDGKRVDIIEKKSGFIFPQFPNKVVVLEFFGKECHHCIQEIATLNRLRQKYTNRLEIISIQVDGQMGKKFANNFIKKHNITYPIIDKHGSENLQSIVKEKYEWRGILPYMLVINRGVTEYSYSGKIDYKRLHNDINSINKENLFAKRVY